MACNRTSRSCNWLNSLSFAQHFAAAPLAHISRTSAAIAVGTGVGLTLVLTYDYLTETMSIFQNRNMIGSAAARMDGRHT